jgi:hypothetical protein
MQEPKLWAAVLLQAVSDCIKPRRSSPGYKDDDARRWFLSDRHGVGSFRWVCEALDLDPQAIRDRVFARDGRPPIRKISTIALLHTPQRP